MTDEPELTQGDDGEWVEHLQQWLNTLGYYSGAIDGSFGPVTQEAVVGAQQQYAIDEGGAVGQYTWKLIALASTANEASQTEVVWQDSQVDEVDVPEVGADEGEVTA